jgi:nuclear pore complex protein Nup85
MTSTNHLNLFPPLIQAGHPEHFIQSGKTISFAQSPLNQSHAVFPSPRVCFASSNCFKESAHNPCQQYASSIRNSGAEEQPIFFASSETSPSSERRLVCPRDRLYCVAHIYVWIVHRRYINHLCCVTKLD